MSLISSTSGIRGTVGGRVGESLTAIDIASYVGRYASWLRQETAKKAAKSQKKTWVVVGRDARKSGEWCSQIVIGTLLAMGWDVWDIGLSTTPTTQMEILFQGALGGIMVSASHNSEEWNALKLLDAKGQFISSKALHTLEQQGHDIVFANTSQQGEHQVNHDAIARHIEAVLGLELVRPELIASQGLRVVVDGINSTGGMALEALLEALGVEKVALINGEPTGHFAHPPEPLTEHLSTLCHEVVAGGYDVGFAVDPDVDRLAIIDEKGQALGEEYTLVAVADYVLSQQPGACVSNLSSSQALAEVAKRHGQAHYYSAVGEVHVVEEMERRGAIIGGEGNGGVIYPSLHAGRDALVGVALFLSYLCSQKTKPSILRANYPDYYLCKRKWKCAPQARIDMSQLMARLAKHYAKYPQEKKDGLRINLPEGWLHVRSSNTEPVIRIYGEAKRKEEAIRWVEELENQLNTLSA